MSIDTGVCNKYVLYFGQNGWICIAMARGIEIPKRFYPEGLVC